MRAEAGNEVPPSLARGLGTRRAIGSGDRQKAESLAADCTASSGAWLDHVRGGCPRASSLCGAKTELRPDRAQRLRRLKVVLK
jgi:hypothetical protein